MTDGTEPKRLYVEDYGVKPVSIPYPPGYLEAESKKVRDTDSFSKWLSAASKEADRQFLGHLIQSEELTQEEREELMFGEGEIIEGTIVEVKGG